MTDSSANGVVEPRVSGETAELARPYALALVSAAEKEGGVEPVLDELDEIQRDVFKVFPRFASLLGSVKVSTAHKDRILTDVFEKRASSVVLRFLRVLNRRDRLGLLAVVAREARAIWDERNKRIPVQVRAAVSLDEKQLQTLRDRLAALTGATPVLSVSTDPGLIGGLVVQVGDHRYDASVKSRLEQLRQRLIEGKMHEIQSRRDQFSHST
jgi:F-type H+-transporting ATPase subunit delta